MKSSAYDHPVILSRVKRSETKSKLQRSPESFRGEARLSNPAQRLASFNGIPRLRCTPLGMTHSADRLNFRLWCWRHRLITNVASGNTQDRKSSDSIDHRCNRQNRSHSDEISESGDNQTGDGHQSEKAHAHNCRYTAPQMGRCLFLHDCIRKAKVH